MTDNPLPDPTEHPLVRLRALMDNPNFLTWYHNEFYSLGFLPISTDAAKQDIRDFATDLQYVIWDLNLDEED